MTNSTLQFTIDNESIMEQLGGVLAKSIVESGLIVYLFGELGAGKTTFVRGFLRALGVSQTIKSPTYTLVEPYEFEEKNIYHFDLYRLASSLELETIGIRDYFHDGAICLIEWPQKGMPLLREPDLTLSINIIQNGRLVEIKANNNRGNNALQTLARNFTTNQ
ncbi:MAG: tRNA (adenosine(37)-N6)-threonylcarbamoyltransferase complex ATPase subunit type 1 TsaE [Candidatus Berkiella sp.]